MAVSAVAAGPVRPAPPTPALGATGLTGASASAVRAGSCSAHPALRHRRAGGLPRRQPAFNVVFDRRDRVDRREVPPLAVLAQLRPAGAVGPAQLIPDLAHLGQQLGLLLVGE